MCQIRYSVAPLDDHWIVRRDCRRMGLFPDTIGAVGAAMRLAAIDRVRGHTVEVLRLEADGRWMQLGADSRHLCDVS